MDPTRRNYSFESRYAQSMLNSRTGKIKNSDIARNPEQLNGQQKGNGRRDENEAAGREPMVSGGVHRTMDCLTASRPMKTAGLTGQSRRGSPRRWQGIEDIKRREKRKRQRTREKVVEEEEEEEEMDDGGTKGGEEEDAEEARDQQPANSQAGKAAVQSRKRRGTGQRREEEWRGEERNRTEPERERQGERDREKNRLRQTGKMRRREKGVGWLVCWTARQR